MAKVIAEGTARAGGSTWRLCIDSDFMPTLQKLTGRKPKQILRAMMAPAGDLALMRKVCLAMLKRHHPDAGIEVAGDIMAEDLPVVGAVIMAGSRAPSGLFGRQAGPRTLH